MQVVPNEIRTEIEKLSRKFPGVPIQLGKSVTALADQNGQMQVTIDDGSCNPLRTSHDILYNTKRMGCLYQMDLSCVGLSEDM